MFDKLRGGLSSVFDKFFSSQITEEQFESAMRELKVSLLEADVHLSTIKKFINNIKEKAIGEKVWKDFTAKKMMTKIVHDELLKLLDSPNIPLTLQNKKNIILMIGLQGSGKTSATAKLANYIKNLDRKNNSILLASLDTYRPAAQMQLETLANQLGVESLKIISEENPIQICKRALKEPHNIIILDTAGRLTIDEEMMEELKTIYDISAPDETLLVVDALIGQSAVKMSKSFAENIKITGLIMTRIDSDAKGGSAISVKDALNVPIKFLCQGEKVSDIETFKPDRIVSRIMDMGDILTLAEKMKSNIDEKDAEKISQRMMKGKFSLEDYMILVKSIRKFGGLASMLGFLPGMNKLKEMSSHVNDDSLSRHMIIMQSMTKKERMNPKILNGSRRLRISKGSGHKVEEVNILLKQYFDMEKMVKQLFGDNSKLLSMMKNFM